MTTYTPREHQEIFRRPLFHRVESVRPAIISLTAPAGFGKTTFVRQLLREVSAFAICDCRGVDSGAEFARRILPALAQEMPDRAASLSQSEGMLCSGSELADRISVASAAWRVRARRAVFVFENAEDVLAVPGALEVLADLLAGRPNDRTVVICSREPLRMHLTRFAPPHQILTLRASDLRFTQEEIGQVFADVEISPRTLAGVVSVSAGWPIAVFLLARFAYEKRLEQLLDALDDIAFEELYEYLAEQILGSLPPALLDMLIAAVGIPHATLYDISLEQPDQTAVRLFEDFKKNWPFVSCSEEGVYAVHPLVATLLTERYPQRARAMLERAAERYEAEGKWLRASELHLARGDREAAARTLNAHEVAEDVVPPIAYSQILASLQNTLILRYPRLWSVSALLRTFSSDVRVMRQEAEEIWKNLPIETPPIVRMSIFVFRLLYMSYLGNFERGLRLIEEYCEQNGIPRKPQNKIHGWLLFMRSLMTARLGRLEEARRDLDAAWPFIHDMYVMGATTLVVLGCDIARVQGDRENERTLLKRACDIAEKSGLGHLIAYTHVEAAFGSWLAGDEGEFSRNAFLLEAEVERQHLHGLVFFTACARGRADKPGASDFLRYIAFGFLIACCDADDGEEAYRYALEAESAAEQYAAPFLTVLSAVALAELGPKGQRGARLEDAEIRAARVDSAALRDAVAAIKEGSPPGFLRVFLERLRRDRRGDGDAIVVEVIAGKVRQGKEQVALSEREFMLMLVCSLRPEPITRERLTDMLWPDLSDDGARNAFHVCLHRLKRRLGSNVVIHTKNGYRLHGDVRVDLWEADRLMTSVRGGAALDRGRVEALHEVFALFKAERPAHFAQWEWFEATERHICELRSEIGRMLAKHALAEKRYEDALALSRELIVYDPWDEPAREITISAYLAAGEHAAALHHFRCYRETLRAELDCDPSAALAQLVGGIGEKVPAFAIKGSVR